MQVASQTDIFKPASIRQWQTVLSIVSTIIFGAVYYISMPVSNPLEYLFPYLGLIALIHIGGNWLIARHAFLFKKEYCVEADKEIAAFFVVGIFFMIIASHVINQEPVKSIELSNILIMIVIFMNIYRGSFKKTIINEEGITINHHLYRWERLKDYHWDGYEGKMQIEFAHSGLFRTAKSVEVNLSNKEADVVKDCIRENTTQ